MHNEQRYYDCGRPSLSPVIRKPISSKFLKKTNSTQITKPTNTSSTQSTLFRHTNNTPTNTHTLHTLTSSSSAPPPSVTFKNRDINNPEIHTNNSAQNITHNYAMKAANDYSPSFEQAFVFNSKDGISKRLYPRQRKNKIGKKYYFVSCISNNQFYIFLSIKQILDSLLETTPNYYN